MYQHNFLPVKLKAPTLKNSDKFKFRAFFSFLSSGKSVLLGVVLTLAVAVGFFGYPSVDALYRASWLIQKSEALEASFSRGDYADFYQNFKSFSYHLGKLEGDTKIFNRLSSWPVLGNTVQNLHTNVVGLNKAAGVFLPITEILQENKGGLKSITSEQRKQILLHLQNYGHDLSLSASMLGSSNLPFWSRQKQVSNALRDLSYLASDLPEVLGVGKPTRYLILFANNLEIRPGGGFIGSYALLTLHDGQIADLSVRDSYLLPGAFNPELGPPAPAPMQKYLSLKGLPFRDANWWPDYPSSVEQIKTMYIKEGGEYGGEIQGVITVTTEILKRLVAITGPVTVGDITFTEDNAISELQKEVEITFWDRGIPETRRKDIVGDLAQILYNRVENFDVNQTRQLAGMFGELLDTQHMALNFNNKKLQNFVSSYDWDASLKNYDSDTLMIVDANLVGYKTEGLMTKSYVYDVVQEGHKLVANLKINYKHRATFFSPLVHNYRTYVRIYVPQDSKLISHQGTNVVDVGDEVNRRVFGTFLIVPVGEERSISFKYELGPNVSAQNYSLLVQKQLGANASNLLIDLDFDNLQRIIKDNIETNRLYQFN